MRQLQPLLLRLAEELEGWRAAASTILDAKATHVGLLLVTLLLLLPPDGVLTDNEENYFQLALQAVTAVPASPDSAVFDASRHRIVSELLLGDLISLVGFEVAQALLRTLTAAAFALLLPPVFRLLSLAALDGVIVVVIFVLLGQNLIGGEWLFHGFEAKVVAYGFVLAALHEASTRDKLISATALCVAATYFHFLVGAFWFLAILGLRLVENRHEIARVVTAAVAFVSATAPLTATIAWTRFAAGVEGATTDTPAPDVIYSLIREPWHGAPFLSWTYFAEQALPGCLMAGAMLVGCIVIARTTKYATQRSVAIWLAALLAYLLLALVPTFIERHTGVVGKFYPFRPSSLVLLLWLALALAWLNGVGIRHFLIVKLLAMVLIAPSFVGAAASRLVGDLEYRADYAAEKQAVAAYLALGTTTHAVVLVDPAIESSFLDFERRTGRPSLVMWKFAPTNDPQLREWYRRMKFRRSLFEEGCRPERPYRTDFLLTTPGTAAALIASCGTVVLKTKHWQLLQRRAPGQ